MQAAAEEPTYTDWIVLENAVVVQEDARRIQIYRRLRRDLIAPAAPSRREDQTWKITVSLEEPKPPKPPEVVFTVREPSAPMNAQREALRFFNDVRELLGLPPTPEAPGQRWSSKPASEANPTMGGPAAARRAMPDGAGQSSAGQSAAPAPPPAPAPTPGAPRPVDLPE